MENLLTFLSESVSEACFNDIISIIENILSEGVDTKKEPEYGTPEYTQNTLDMLNRHIDSYTNGSSKNHPYAPQILHHLKILHKMNTKDLEKQKAAAATKQAAQV